MDPGNLIIHLPLQARNLAVTLESDLSLSHPTSSPLPSSVESSPKYLLDATPPLHCHSLCPGSAPQPLSLLNHHQHFRTASPPDSHRRDGSRSCSCWFPCLPPPFKLVRVPLLQEGDFQPQTKSSGPGFGLLFQLPFLLYTPVLFAPYVCFFSHTPMFPLTSTTLGMGLLLAYLAHSSSKVQLLQEPSLSPFGLNWESSCGLLWLPFHVLHRGFNGARIFLFSLQRVTRLLPLWLL